MSVGSSRVAPSFAALVRGSEGSTNPALVPIGMQSGNTELTYKLLAGGKARSKALAHISHTLTQHPESLERAAKVLGVTKRTLQRWIKRYPTLTRARHIGSQLDTVQRMRSGDMHVIVQGIVDTDT